MYHPRPLSTHIFVVVCLFVPLAPIYSWDEELKMSLMIARNWGTTLYTEGENSVQTCALGENFVAAMNSTVEVTFAVAWVVWLDPVDLMECW